MSQLCWHGGELLAQGKVLQQETAMAAEDAQKGADQEPKEVEHGGKVIADCPPDCLSMLLISKADGVVTIDKLLAKGEVF